MGQSSRQGTAQSAVPLHLEMFRCFWVLNYRRLEYIASKFARPPTEAKDILHGAFLTAAKSLQRKPQGISLKSYDGDLYKTIFRYLCGCIRNHAGDLGRRGARNARTVQQLSLEENGYGRDWYEFLPPARETISAELRGLARRLPGGSRDLFELFAGNPDVDRLDVYRLWLARHGLPDTKRSRGTFDQRNARLRKALKQSGMYALLLQKGAE